MNRCDATRKLLSPWLDQEISAEAAAEVEEHLERCSACAAEVARMRAVDELLNLRVDAGDLSDRILAEIRSRRPSLGFWLRTAAAVIASVGLGLAAGQIITGDDSTVPAPTRSASVLVMIDDHFGANSLAGIDDLARDLQGGARR